MKPLEITNRPPKYIVKFTGFNYGYYGLASYTQHNSLAEAKRSAKRNKGTICVRDISRLSEISLVDQYIPIANQ